ncbi:MAG: carbohydrate kinase family protein [Chloroflexi bacterium]|nr:carbohydrate kinase family protein [Chloroflexota bacterium]MCC6893552.1 carbohydrate kinase family protein [Anaerolineae bacterium]
MDIIVTGSIAYDYLMRFPGRFNEYFIDGQMHQVSLSFLVDEMTKHWGGIGANISYTLGLLGHRAKLMGTVGRDFGDYRVRLESVGIDTSGVREHADVFTASYFANTDLENNTISSFYSGAMAFSKDFTIAEAYPNLKPDMVIISPSDPLAMTYLTKECRERDIPFIYDPSQQIPRLTGEELLSDMQGAYAMVVNAYEAEIICKKTNQSLEDLKRRLELLIITQGKNGSHVYQKGELTQVPAFGCKEIKDPTGAGDAFRGGLLRGLAAGWPITLCAMVGSLCASYVLENVGTQTHHFTIPEFIERFRSEHDDQGQLDSLLQAAPVTK